MKKMRVLGWLGLFFYGLCVAKAQSPLHVTFGKSKSNFQNFIKTNKIVYIQEDTQVDSFPMISQIYRFDTLGNMISFEESGQKWAIETIYTYDKNDNLIIESRKEIQQISNQEGKLTESNSEKSKIYEYQNNQLVSILNTATGEKARVRHEYRGDTTVITTFYNIVTEILKILPRKEIKIMLYSGEESTDTYTREYDTLGNLIRFEMPNQFDPSASSVFTSEYEYDGDGNVLKKIEKIFNAYHKASTSKTVVYRYDLSQLEKIESVAWGKLKENRYFQYRYQSGSIRKK